MKNLLIFSLLISSLTIISCSDDDGPSVTITSPENNTVYTTGTNIVIMVSGTASDDVGVTDLKVAIKGDDGVILNESQDLSSITDKTDFTFSGNLTVTGILAGDYELTLTAFDADGNTDEDSVDFSVE